MSELEITTGYNGNLPEISRMKSVFGTKDAGNVPMVSEGAVPDSNIDDASLNAPPQKSDNKPTYEDIISELFAGNKVNTADFDIDKLKTYFPDSKYSIHKASDTQCYIFDNNTGECVYDITYTDSGFNISRGGNQKYKFNTKGQLFEYNKTGEGFYSAKFANETLYYERYFDETEGKVVEKNILADRLVSVFGNNGISSGGVTKSEIKTMLTDMLTSENIEEIALVYYDKTGGDLIDDIKRFSNSNLLNEDEIAQCIDHINACFYNPNFKNENSKVVNTEADYEGDTYSVSQSGNTMTITNKDKNETFTIDFDKLFKNVGSTDRARIIRLLQQMPAEVLADLAIEVDLEVDKKGSNQGRSGYDHWNDKIVLGKKDFKLQSLIHEIGHALDGMATHGRYRSIMKSSANIGSIFEEEMKEYEKAGNRRHDETYDYSKNRWDPLSMLKNTAGDYATWSNVEMFAECYTLIMTGNCVSKNVILKYFPRTLQAAKESILWTRQQPISDRRILD